MADALEERLKSHARAFEGLMSLIPAKQYYEQDNSEQWKKKNKKQSKQEKKAARKAKLDPENYKSAKDILDENERKRKRELEDEDDMESAILPVEKPREGLKTPKSGKKLKLQTEILPTSHAETGVEDGDAAARRVTKAEKKKEKQQRKKEKKEKFKQAPAKSEGNEEDDEETTQSRSDDAVLADIEISHGDETIEPVDISGLVEDDQQDDSSTASLTPEPQSPESSASIMPSTSSISSIIPPSNAADGEKPKKEKLLKLPDVDHEVLKARLRTRLDALRAARNADGIDGKPARTRQELIEARRRKTEQRKALKKELRRQSREEEEKAKVEAELARLRGSGSPLTVPDIFSPRTEELQHNFSFGRVKFDDGHQMDSSLTTFLDPSKKKGPQDTRTALEAAERKRAKLNGLDEEKRADIEAKDLWLNAKKRVHGEKVRDDTSLLKKTLKRKEKSKLKSEKEWNERIAGVQKGQEMRQKKREENIKKRKEEKGKGKGKGQVKKSSKKPKSRPGFEGSFRAKAR